MIPNHVRYRTWEQFRAEYTPTVSNGWHGDIDTAAYELGRILTDALARAALIPQATIGKIVA